MVGLGVKMLPAKFLFCVLFLFITPFSATSKDDDTQEFCSLNPNENDGSSCGGSSSFVKGPRFLFYDVNPPEGFNLRRDVYMRMAVMAKKLAEKGDWHLVLPPWPRLYHWRSIGAASQERLPWSLFFDLTAMRAFAPVMDMEEFFSENKMSVLDDVYILQHFKEDWEAGRWEEKYALTPCNEPPPYVQESGDGEDWSGPFLGFFNISASSVQCLSFHGQASLLVKFLEDSSSKYVMVDHAEVALHDSYGDVEYWHARRSMRFAPRLRSMATEFRKEHLMSTDEADGTVRPDDWRQEKGERVAKGGPYLCAHLRRRDFVWGHGKDVPSLTNTARQLNDKMASLGLKTVFIATDAPESEFQELEDLMAGYNVVKFRPSPKLLREVKDGGVAIIEQIICSHARYFIGTHESTFSFRIQEEREIMGFDPDTTFNRLCGDEDDACPPPSRWLAVF